MVLRNVTLTVGLLLVGFPAWGADSPAPPIVRGTIVGIDAKSVSIKKADGGTLTVALAPDAAFSVVEARRFEQIKASDFVGITTLPGPNDTLKAQEIHILPVKGTHEGSYPWDHAPDGVKAAQPATATNGTVAAVRDEPPATYTMTNANVTTSFGMQLKVSYRGSAIVGGRCVGRAPEGSAAACTGVATVDVAPWTPIVAVVPASAAAARVGLAVFATTATSAQGKAAVTSLVVEKNGLKPIF